jgi:predicted protein tyrosine phosphatase
MSAFHHIRSMPLTKALTIVREGSPAVLISVVTPGDPVPPFAGKIDRWLVVEQPDGQPMSPETAQRIARFCRQHKHQSRPLFVHCLMGMSRSPSIANGIAQHYGMEVWHMQPYTQPMPPMVDAVREALAMPSYVLRPATCGCRAIAISSTEWRVMHELTRCKDHYGRVLEWDEFVQRHALKIAAQLDEAPDTFVQTFTREANQRDTITHRLLHDMFVNPGEES